MGIATLAHRGLSDETRGFAGWHAADRPDILDLAGLIGFDLSYRFSQRLTFGVGADAWDQRKGSARLIIS